MYREEMILLWELEELLTQELEDITEVIEDIGREELRDDFRTHVMYRAEMMQREKDEACAERKLTVPSAYDNEDPSSSSHSPSSSIINDYNDDDPPSSSSSKSNANYDNDDPIPPSSSPPVSIENATFDDDDPPSPTLTTKSPTSTSTSSFLYYLSLK